MNIYKITRRLPRAWSDDPYAAVIVAPTREVVRKRAAASTLTTQRDWAHAEIEELGPYTGAAERPFVVMVAYGPTDGETTG